MFGKLFASMFDGSLHGRWEATVTLQQFVILANRHGEVDMTPESISARTGIPLELLRKGIAVLEEPDPQSRGPAEEGRRLVRLSPGRAWGWRIVNYLFYRNLASAEDKREGARVRQARHREAVAASRSVTPRNAVSRESRHADADADAKAEEEPEKQGPRLALVRPGREATAHAVSLPLKGTTREAVLSEAHIADLQAAYPAIDVVGQLLRMRSWLVSNPGKQKTARGVLRFVDSWLKGEAEDRDRSVKAAGGRRAADAAYAQEVSRGRS